MLAQLQRRLLALVVAIALAWWMGWMAAARPVIAWMGFAVCALGYTAVLALEFWFVAALHRDDPTPRASLAELVQAWWGECIVALRVFGWRQPFRSHVCDDIAGRPAVRGVVFVHGYLCNRGLWNPWLVRCAARSIPCVAVNLEPVFSPLDTYVPQLEKAIAQLERSTGLPPLLVCHSMGGLVARAWAAATPRSAARVQHIVTIGTPHQGTWLARLSRTSNALHMQQASAWLAGLAAREPSAHGELYTCFYGHADNIVFPARSGCLPGADNRHLRATAHVAMAYHPAVFSEVDRWLEKGSEASVNSDRVQT